MVDNREFAQIIASESDCRLCEVVNLNQFRQFPQNFFWRHNPHVMKVLKEESERGDFNFIVLIFG